MTTYSVVIDKSYLYSASKECIFELAKSYRLMICESFLYEAVKEKVGIRARLFSKLPEPVTYWEYIPTVGYLIRYEQKNIAPCGNPSKHIVLKDYSNTKLLANADSPLPSDIQIALHKYANHTNEYFEPMLNRIRKAYQEFTASEAKTELKELLEGKIKNNIFVNKLITQERAEGALIPEFEFFSSNWVTYRFCQVQYLHAIDTRCRYASINIIQNSEKAKTKILHDVHDLNYLILALLEGQFATNEKS